MNCNTQNKMYRFSNKLHIFIKGFDSRLKDYPPLWYILCHTPCLLHFFEQKFSTSSVIIDSTYLKREPVTLNILSTAPMTTHVLLSQHMVSGSTNIIYFFMNVSTGSNSSEFSTFIRNIVTWDIVHSIHVAMLCLFTIFCNLFFSLPLARTWLLNFRSKRFHVFSCALLIWVSKSLREISSQ